MPNHEPVVSSRPSSDQHADTQELRAQLLKQLARVRGSLQKWHSAVSRRPGGAAGDMFRGQGRALALLDEHGEMPQRDMCTALGIRPQSLGETLTKLERAGYITRRISDLDHRALLVSITPAGRTVVERSEPNPLFESFNSDELEQFIGYLDRALVDIDGQLKTLDDDRGSELEAPRATTRVRVAPQRRTD